MKRSVFNTTILTLIFLSFTSRAEQGTGDPGTIRKTPPMGWNSWNTFKKGISEQLIKQVADAVKKYKLDEAGYKYIVIDDGWQKKELGPNGELVPDPEKFPNGISPLVQYVRHVGLELGIYSCPNPITCGGRAGSLGHEGAHARQFADWGCAFVKYDYCPVRTSEEGLDGPEIIERYRTFGAALKAANPSTLYAICEKGWAGKIAKRQRTADSPPITADQRRKAFAWCKEAGGVMWRTTGDISPEWKRIMQIVDDQQGLESLSGPNAFNDLDMLEVGNGKLTESENRAHFSLWCVLNAPLILGNDLREIPESVLKIITNSEMIDLNQDPLCKQADKVVDHGDIAIYSKQLANGDRGVCVLNRGKTSSAATIEWNDMGFATASEWTVRDLWQHKDLGTLSDKLEVSIPSHDVVVYRFAELKK